MSQLSPALSTPALKRDFLVNTGVFLEVALIVLITLFLSVLWYLYGGNEAWDDAFISFRYSSNLASGHGLVWNIGGEPTQGYTSLLFVLAVAVGELLNQPPTTWAFVLNTLGLITIALSFYVLARHLFPDHGWLRMVPSLAIVWMPVSISNVLTGMETVFWTGLVFLTVTFIVRYSLDGKPRDLIVFGVLAFLTALTRPESVLFAGLWFLFLLLAVRPPQRRHVLIAIVIFGIAGLLYLFWLHLYFGSILPNPFYIKVDKPSDLPGLSYVMFFLIYYFNQYGLVVIGSSGLVLLLMIPFRRGLLAPYLVVMLLIPFFVFTRPLIGANFRFLYPVACLFTFLLTSGLVQLIVNAKRPLAPNALLRVGTRIVLVGSVLVVSVIYLIKPGYELTRTRLSIGASEEFPYGNVIVAGQLLADVPGIENVTIAYGDAGKVPYYTNSQSIDVVGLNNNTIARLGSERGGLWVVDYVLAQSPDLIAFYSSDRGEIFNAGHGVIGRHYSDLYQHEEFQNHYIYVGGFAYGPKLYGQWFVRQDSAYRDALIDAIRSEADVVEMEFIP